ncbi:hypothetical protein X801_04349 [Opisthorchis viverrini]|uniref:Uncharacterized protein n=1 Tax=Opisthorchis viverrini TaxID=6198 RepID=A0A1S8WZE1_OPIVI|nr:hypothetical protein X801_04349 [Opisthorchis viverrini]
MGKNGPPNRRDEPRRDGGGAKPTADFMALGPDPHTLVGAPLLGIDASDCGVFSLSPTIFFDPLVLLLAADGYERLTLLLLVRLLSLLLLRLRERSGTRAAGGFVNGVRLRGKRLFKEPSLVRASEDGRLCTAVDCCEVICLRTERNGVAVVSRALEIQWSAGGEGVRPSTGGLKTGGEHSTAGSEVCSGGGASEQDTTASFAVCGTIFAALPLLSLVLASVVEGFGVDIVTARAEPMKDRIALPEFDERCRGRARDSFGELERLELDEPDFFAELLSFGRFASSFLATREVIAPSEGLERLRISIAFPLLSVTFLGVEVFCRTEKRFRLIPTELVGVCTAASSSEESQETCEQEGFFLDLDLTASVERTLSEREALYCRLVARQFFVPRRVCIAVSPQGAEPGSRRSMLGIAEGNTTKAGVNRRRASASEELTETFPVLFEGEGMVSGRKDSIFK